MHRFFLPPAHCSSQPLLLTGREAHHALHVLRLQKGDAVTVLDGSGREFRCQIEGHDRDKVHLSIDETRQHPQLPFQITLLQALPKGKLIESIVQKATELGAFRIVPLLSERVVTRLDGKEAAQKAQKWQQIAIEALKQCGSPWLTRVEEPVALTRFLARAEKSDLSLLGSLQPGAKHPREYFEAFRAQHGQPPKSVFLWIGPEGDFSASEIGQIQSAGAMPITLGPLVLRTETAALYCLSLVNYELQSPV